MAELPDRPDRLSTMDRRSFLRTGVGGTLFLGTVGITANLSGCAGKPAGRYEAATGIASDYRFGFLTHDDIVLFGALLPTVIGPGLPQQAADRQQAILGTIERIDAGILQFGPANQKELRRLFDLLNFGLTRVTVARVWPDWASVSPAQAGAFLDRWRSSRIGLLNNGYIALTKLSNVAFYGHPAQWHLSGYPGPPAWATQALPQFQNAS